MVVWIFYQISRHKNLWKDSKCIQNRVDVCANNILHWEALSVMEVLQSCLWACKMCTASLRGLHLCNCPSEICAEHNLHHCTWQSFFEKTIPARKFGTWGRKTSTPFPWYLQNYYLLALLTICGLYFLHCYWSVNDLQGPLLGRLFCCIVCLLLGWSYLLSWFLAATKMLTLCPILQPAGALHSWFQPSARK